MPSKIQGVLCANNAEAIQRLNVAVEQLSEQLHEVHLNPMFTELIRTLQELRAKLASRDDEIERLVERVTRLERKNVGRMGTENVDENDGRTKHYSHCANWVSGGTESCNCGLPVKHSDAHRELIRRRT